MHQPQNLAPGADDLPLPAAVAADEILLLPVGEQRVSRSADHRFKRLDQHKHPPHIRLLQRRDDGQFFRRALDVADAVIVDVHEVTVLYARFP